MKYLNLSSKLLAVKKETTDDWDIYLWAGLKMKQAEKDFDFKINLSFAHFSMEEEEYAENRNDG